MRIPVLKKIDTLFGPLLVRLLPKPRQVTLIQPPQRILLLRPGGIGDAVHLVPVVKSLIKTYPGCCLDVLAEKRNSHVFALCKDLDRVYRYDCPRDLIKVLNASYDVVIDSEQWHRLSAVIVRLLAGRVSIGFASNERQRLFTDTVEYSHDDYEVDNFLRLLTPLKIDLPPSETNPPFLKIPEGTRSVAQLLPDLSKAYVVLFPGASIEERKWGAGHFAELAIKVMGLGADVVLVGGKEDAEVAAEILSRASGVFSLAGTCSLMESASVISGASLIVSGDSGILHIAVGLDIPTVSLFGPGIAAKWAPRGEKHIVINHELECSPCTKFGYTPRCQTGAPCIANISVDEVFSAVKTLIVRARKEN